MPKSEKFEGYKDVIELIAKLPTLSEEVLERIRIACIKENLYGGIHLAVAIEQNCREQLKEAAGASE